MTAGRRRGGDPAPAVPTAADLRDGRAELLARRSLTGAALRSALVDLYDSWLAGVLGDARDVALVAVGGLGRREPAAYADLDLVLLHRGRRDVAEVADTVWYPVWDAGIGLDHSVRTVAEAVAVARDDLKAGLGLLELRHLAGDPALSGALRRGRVRELALRAPPAPARAAGRVPGALAGRRRARLPAGARPQGGARRPAGRARAAGAGGGAARRRTRPGGGRRRRRPARRPRRAAAPSPAGRWTGWCSRSRPGSPARSTGPTPTTCSARSARPAGPSPSPPTPPGDGRTASWPARAGRRR